MGFRTKAYATVWQVNPKTDTLTSVRISISRKNKQTGQWDTDFSGYASFIGTANAKKALTLKERDRIRLKDVDVTQKFVKQGENGEGKTYTNFNVYSFETQEEIEAQNSAPADPVPPQAYEGEPEDSMPW